MTESEIAGIRLEILKTIVHHYGKWEGDSESFGPGRNTLQLAELLEAVTKTSYCILGR